MSWILKLLAKLKLDPTDVLNQQMGDEVLRAVKEMLL